MLIIKLGSKRSFRFAQTMRLYGPNYFYLETACVAFNDDTGCMGAFELGSGSVTAFL